MLSHSPPALHGLQLLPLADKTFDIFLGKELNICQFSGTRVGNLLQDVLPKASRRILSMWEASLVTTLWERFDVLPLDALPPSRQSRHALLPPQLSRSETRSRQKLTCRAPASEAAQLEKAVFTKCSSSTTYLRLLCIVGLPWAQNLTVEEQPLRWCPADSRRFW